MERIKQALEKAREDRMRSGAPDMMGGPTTVTPVTQISYSQTRSHPVQPELLREQRVIIGKESSDTADAYKILRTQVMQRLNENNWNALAITSPGDNEGKTLTAINLAISLAEEVTCTVLLVDADLRNPSLHAYFDLSPGMGLSDYLTGDIPLSELLVNPAGFERFVLLPGGKPLANSAEMLNSPKMKRLVEELKERYRSRIILFDLPPLLSSADALAFSPYVDAALLVIEEGKTPAAEIQRAAELLQNTRLIGTVLNKAHVVGKSNPDSDAWLEKKLHSLHNNRFVQGAGNRMRNLLSRFRKQRG
jgi:capsular exopolysaccharide synthesis family protein